ncbi:MAG: sulfatase-like hydrolase/transferase, partial [Armatimonadota bacterium]
MADRPNVLMITTDHQRYDCLGVNGNPLIQTPSLDRLAREGVNFSRFYATNPVC